MPCLKIKTSPRKENGGPSEAIHTPIYKAFFGSMHYPSTNLVFGRLYQGLFDVQTDSNTKETASQTGNVPFLHQPEHNFVSDNVSQSHSMSWMDIQAHNPPKCSRDHHSMCVTRLSTAQRNFSLPLLYFPHFLFALCLFGYSKNKRQADLSILCLWFQDTVLPS